MIYDQTYARRYRAHDEALLSSVPSQQLAAWLGEICRRFDHPIDVLDLGCGTGRYFWALIGVRGLVGVDASPAMLAEARHPFRAEQIGAECITLVEGELSAQQYPNESFDLVYSVGVLAEHAPFTAAIVGRVHAWLRPGGRFAFTTVHPESPSVPRTVKRRLASMAAPLLPGGIGRALHDRLLSGGMYADEQRIHELLAGGFSIETLDRFQSEAHLHCRCVARKAAA